MKASPRATKQFTGAVKAIETYGDDLWCAACDVCQLDTKYHLWEIVERIAPDFPQFATSTLTQYLRATLLTVIDQGNDQVRKVGNWWVFPSV